MSFIELASNDKAIIKIKTLMESGIYAKINTKELKQELLALHNTKSVVSMSFDKIFANPAKLLSSSMLKNQRSRTRAVAIKMECYEVLCLLKEHMETAVNYLRSKYQQQLNSEFKVSKDKDSAIAQVLVDFYKKQRKLESVIWVADSVVEDLDKAGWTIKNTIDLFNLQARRE